MLKQDQKQILNTPSLSAINLNLFHTILSYLTPQQLIIIMKAISYNRSLILHSNFIKIKYCYNQYYNRSDKSYYFLLFENSQYLKRQADHFVQRSKDYQKNFNQFLSFPKKYNNLLTQCLQSIDEELQNDFTQQLQSILFDPCIPMPKMFRQTVTTQASSPLQNFLLYSVYNQHGLQFNEELFQKLNKKFDELQETHMIQMMGNYQSAYELINYGYTINYQNRNKRTIPGNKLHNLLVCVFSITDIQLELIYQYLKGINDPFQCLVHLNTKYQQFISLVISIEENMGNLFKLYQQLYNEVFAKSSTTFSFWKYALAMWINKMSDFHSITHQANNDMVDQICSSRTKQLLKQNNMLLLLNDQTKAQNKSFVYQLMNANQNEIIILANNYQDYLIDLSISEATIPYCGHSDQNIDQLFLSYEKELVKNESKFIDRLKKNLALSLSEVHQIANLRVKTFQQIVKPRTVKLILKEYEALEVKPITIRRLILKDDQIQRYVQFINKNNPDKLSSLNQDTAYAISKGLGNKSALETTDSDEHSFQFYESEIDGEQECQEIYELQLNQQKMLYRTK